MSYKTTGLKRKRTVHPPRDFALVPYKSAAVYKKRRRTFVPGRDRVGGFYGRFAGANAELKFHDVDLDDAVVDVGGTITPTINIIIQGITESTRIGRKCTIKSVWWHALATLPELDAGVTPNTSDQLRCIIYLDKQANAATAVVTDILETASWQSFKNLANQMRFVYLLDKVYTLNYQGLASDGAGVVSQASVYKTIPFYKACDIPIEYSGTTGAIGEIRSNNIGVLLISASGQVTLQSKFRLRFSDN